ncbi:50S ribosomal protein L25/general stress protein Ctc [Flavobacteriales bacterium]|jgi:large subunit ribosomal protein L25|nr:50S ribosomal protein L25/general stress protein Ctc [Flavobacteriales bacterium]
MKSVSISAEKRVDLGKKEAKALRAAGKVPCVVYGGETVQHFSATEIAFNNLVYTPNVYAVAIDIEGTTVNALIKDIQFHPVTDRIIHIDFIELTPGQSVNTEIPVVLNGNAIGVRNGGKLRKTLRKLSVRATPENLPDAVTLDISTMKIGEKIYVRDVDAKGFDILTSGNAVIVAVKTARNVVEEEEEEEEGAEAAADAPAAEAPAAE